MRFPTSYFRGGDLHATIRCHVEKLADLNDESDMGFCSVSRHHDFPGVVVALQRKFSSRTFKEIVNTYEK